MEGAAALPRAPGTVPSSMASFAYASDDFPALLELARCSGLDVSPDMFLVVLELLRLDVTPQGIVAFLRALKNAKVQAAQHS